MTKDALAEKIYNSLINNFDEWEVTGCRLEDYQIRNRINNFVITWNGSGYPKITEPGLIHLSDGMFTGKYKKLIKKIKSVCGQHEDQVVHNNFKLLNDMYDSKFTLRFSYKIICEFGEGDFGGSRRENDEVYKRQSESFKNYLTEFLVGNYKLNLHLNRTMFHIKNMSNIWIGFEKEQDMSYMILKWSDYIVTSKTNDR